ncbi:hypothetical protein F5B21DRAFT_526776 [Xylaria acuta]|nr:hypothetical protein F5B21DRAFT_526776 [Xylaria acuta]
MHLSVDGGGTIITKVATVKKSTSYMVKTKSHSEILARQFANEPVLGFDMEWPWGADKRSKLRDKVALMQLAGERKVALFHIALHEGETVDDLIAPTLKEIIESSKNHERNVRISDWSQPLNWNQTQYAATDAYARFMLFHCMNAKRLAMDPAPPFPIPAETYLRSIAPKSTTLQLESLTENGEVRTITAKGFFGPTEDIDQDEELIEGIADNKNDDIDSDPKNTNNTRRNLRRG